jgi:hypothetical protein
MVASSAKPNAVWSQLNDLGGAENAFLGTMSTVLVHQNDQFTKTGSGQT